MATKRDILWRVYLVYFIVLLFGLGIIAKVVYIQLYESEELLLKAQKQELKHVSLEANRGNIYDDNGNLLATSVPVFEIRLDIDSEHISDALFNSKIDSLALGLSKLFGRFSTWSYKSKLKKARKDGNRYYLIERRATYSQLKELRKFPILRRGKYLGGLIAIPKTTRKMPFGSLAKRTIGYENREAGIYVGLEGAYANYVQGIAGQQLQRKLNNGDWIPVNDENDILPIDGKDIITSIDISIQDVAENALNQHLIKHGASQGCAVLMEVNTGFVKAIVNLRYNSKSNTYEESYNYAIAENVEPGSTFKLVSIIAALELGRINLNDSIDTGNGEMKYYDRIMRDDHKIGDGKITVRDAFEKSSNVGISKIITEMFEDKPSKYVDFITKVSIDKPLGLEILGEGTPFIKHPKNKKTWYGTTLPWMSIGYELTLTPLQTLTYYNAIANNGKMVKPQFVKEIRKGNQVIEYFDPIVIEKSICSQQTVDTVKSLLEGVVSRGTAKLTLGNSSYKIAGKTGTAQIAEGSSGYNKSDYNASFVGYFPADEPKYSCIIVVNNPTKGRIYGSSVAAPVFKEIADKIVATQLNFQTKNNGLEKYQSTPSVSKGQFEDIQALYVKMDLPVRSECKTEWYTSTIDASSERFSDLGIPKGFVPNVRGMGVRDAVYLLESTGVKTKVIGKGKVSSQSIRAGTVIVAGMEIILNLSS
ncbi:MAG: transpeptidase family protein [Bacteroidetes bacterium]|nr:transpeptidase family protein [Bacteroidota bacterium]